MKAIFGILSLIIVLAIVGVIAKNQLRVAGGGMSAQNAKAASEAGLPDIGRRDAATAPTAAIPRGMPGAELADPNGLTVRDEARSIQQKARDDTARALEQGAQRNSQAER